MTMEKKNNHLKMYLLYLLFKTLGDFPAIAMLVYWRVFHQLVSWWLTCVKTGQVKEILSSLGTEIGPLKLPLPSSRPWYLSCRVLLF